MGIIINIALVTHGNMEQYVLVLFLQRKRKAIDDAPHDL